MKGHDNLESSSEWEVWLLISAKKPYGWRVGSINNEHIRKLDAGTRGKSWMLVKSWNDRTNKAEMYLVLKGVPEETYLKREWESLGVKEKRRRIHNAEVLEEMNRNTYEYFMEGHPENEEEELPEVPMTAQDKVLEHSVDKALAKWKPEEQKKQEDNEQE